MHYFGDNFVTLGQNMDLNEYWCPSSDAGYPRISCTLIDMIRVGKKL